MEQSSKAIMISGNSFVNSTKMFFSFLENEFGMKINEIIVNGNFFYAIRYSNDFFLVSISYENIENYFNVQLIRKIDGMFASFDDVNNSINLKRLYFLTLKRISKCELDKMNAEFDIHTNNNFEKMILESAKKLKTCLNNINYIWKL